MKEKVTSTSGLAVVPTVKPTRISQEELLKLLELEENLKSAEASYKLPEEDLRKRKLGGAEVEPGRVLGGLKDTSRASVSWKQEYISVCGASMAARLEEEARRSKQPSWKFWAALQL